MYALLPSQSRVGPGVDWPQDRRQARPNHNFIISNCTQEYVPWLSREQILSALPTNYSKHLTESQNHSPVGNFGESLIQIPSFYTEASMSQTLCWALGQKDYTI